MQHVAIWGAGFQGKRCWERARESGLKVDFFIDMNPPAGGLCMGLPVYSSNRVLSDMSGELQKVDGLFLAFQDTKEHALKDLERVGFTKPVIRFVEGIGFERLIKDGRQ